MEYRNKVSTIKTIESYMEAFDKMVVLCPKVKIDSNSFNQRIVLPTRYTPTFGRTIDHLIPEATWGTVRWERLFEILDKPKIITPKYHIWNSDWLTINWGIDFPFEIYDWEIACQELTNREEIEADETVEPKYRLIPEQMKPHFKEHITLTTRYGEAKKWGLKDWNNSYHEIETYMDSCKNDKVVEQYRKHIIEANDEVRRWEKAMHDLQSVRIV